jgi:hypothetical protein
VKTNHAFVPPAIAAVGTEEEAAESGFFAGNSTASGACARRIRNVDVIRDFQECVGTPESRGLKSRSKVAVFREDKGKRLLDNIDGGSVNKCDILIDPDCARIRQSNGRANAAVLGAFKPSHTGLHAQSRLVTLGLVPPAQDNRVSY